MSKILILSDNNSLWTKRCINHSNILGDNDIYVLSTEPAQNDTYYSSNGIHICHVKRHPFLERIPKIRRLVINHEFLRTVLQLCKEIGDIDVLHISFVTVEKMHVIRKVRTHVKKIVCSFWGSDLFRASDKQLSKYTDSFQYVDVIMLSTTEMLSRFVEFYGNRFDSKIQKIRFGIEELDFINSFNSVESKKHFNIPAYKTVITIGYNGREAQNHLFVIRALSRLPKTIKDRIYIQLPVTYGLISEYESQLIKELDSCGCDYYLYKGFLDDIELGKLRESSDIFIHAQITDAAAASVQEYLYAKKIVFNAIWVQYSDLKESGVFYFEYNDYDKLFDLILNYFQNGLSSSEIMQISKNPQIIWELSSWETVSEKWHSLYCVS